MRDDRRSGIFVSFLWMFFLSILLFWLPVFGQFIAGFVGGKKAGGVTRAMLAFFLPAIIFSLLFIFVFPLIPILGLGLGIMLALNNFALFCGAIVGGALA